MLLCAVKMSVEKFRLVFFSTNILNISVADGDFNIRRKILPQNCLKTLRRLVALCRVPGVKKPLIGSERSSLSERN